jgi:hypothetical protein
MNTRGSAIRAALAISASVCAIGALASEGLAAVPSTAPSAATGGFRNVRGTTAELLGSVNPNGQPTTYYFLVGPPAPPPPAPAPALSTPLPPLQLTVPGSGTATSLVKVGETATNLLPKSRYRLVAINSLGQKAEGKIRVYEPTKTAFKVVLTKPSPFVQNLIGSPVTLAGGLTGGNIANHGVVLQASAFPYTAPFTNVLPAQTTDASGRFSFRVPSLLVNTEYRVATTDPRPTISSVVTELASVRVTLHVRHSSHPGIVRMYGTISPAVVGAHVLIQLERTATKRTPPKTERAEERAEMPSFASKFTTLSKRATKSFSRFSMIVKLVTTGHYRALVSLPKGPIASGYSSTTATLHAAPSKKKHKK